MNSGQGSAEDQDIKKQRLKDKKKN